MSSIDSWRQKQHKRRLVRTVIVLAILAVAVTVGILWPFGSSDKAKSADEPRTETKVAVADSATRRQFHQLETAIEQGDVKTQTSFVASLFHDDFATKAQPMFPKGTDVRFELGGATGKNTLVTDSPETGQVECIVSHKQTYIARILKENAQWRIIYMEPK